MLYLSQERLIHVTLPDAEGTKKQFCYKTHNKICGLPSVTRSGTMELNPRCHMGDSKLLTAVISWLEEEKRPR